MTIIEVLFLASLVLPAAYLTIGLIRKIRVRHLPETTWFFLVPAAGCIVGILFSGFPSNSELAMLGAYGVVGVMGVGRLLMGLQSPKAGAVNAVVNEEEQEPKEVSCCIRQLPVSGGAIPQNKSGTSGTSWLLGSNYYKWDLLIYEISVTSSGVTVGAIARGEYIPWYGITFRNANATASATGSVWCLLIDGQCEARGSGGKDAPKSTAFDAAVTIDAIPGRTPQEISLKVDAVAAIEGALVIEEINLGGSASGSVAGAKLTGTVSTKINIQNEAEDKLRVERTYNYLCEPCQSEE